MAAFIDKIAMQIQKIPTKTRLYGFGGLVLVLCGVYIYFVHIPMTSEISQLKKNTAALQTKISDNEQKIKKLAELREEVKALEDRLQLLTEQLPPGSEVSGLLSQIQNLVNQSGLNLKIWRPGARKIHSSGLYEEIPISMDLVGGYHNVGVFFDRVSKLTRIVNMLNLKMAGASPNKAGGVDIKISCTALTFAAVEKKPDAGPAIKKGK